MKKKSLVDNLKATKKANLAAAPAKNDVNAEDKGGVQSRSF